MTRKPDGVKLIYNPFDEDDAAWLKRVCKVAGCEPNNLLQKAKKIKEVQP